MYFVVLLFAHSLLCIVLIGLVLLQQGKGADAGATFGGGGNTVFGAAGATDFITKLTTGLAVGFMFTSILLIRGYQQGGASIFSNGTVDLLGGSMMEQSEVEVKGEGDVFAGAEVEVAEEGETAGEPAEQAKPATEAADAKGEEAPAEPAKESPKPKVE